MADGVQLDNAGERIAAGIDAGNEYIAQLEGVRDKLAADEGDEQATLGQMVGAQLEMTEIETQYMVESGIPKKASAAHQAAAQDVKKAAG